MPFDPRNKFRNTLGYAPPESMLAPGGGSLSGPQTLAYKPPAAMLGAAPKSDYVRPDYDWSTGSAAQMYDNLVKAVNASAIKNNIGTDWLTSYKDKLINEIIPAGQARWGNAAIQNAFLNNWKKAILASWSAATGNPYYDRTGDGTRAKLLSIPGFTPQGAPSEIDYQGQWWVT